MTTQALAVRSAVDIITTNKEQFLAAVPRDVDRDRFFAVAISILKDEKLAKCTERSKLDSIYRFARLGFDPDPVMGEGYVIPRNCKRRVKVNGQWQDQWENVACFQPGYRGLTKLARKSRTIADIHAEVVYEGEPFGVHYGTNRRIEHEPCVSVDAEPGAIRAAYVTWLDLTSRTVNFHVIDRKRIARARAVNKKEDRASPWDTDEAAMVRKTAIIDASKFWQLSAEFAEAIDLDQHAEGDVVQPSVTPPSLSIDATVEEEERGGSELDDFAETGVANASRVDHEGGNNAAAVAGGSVRQPTTEAPAADIPDDAEAEYERIRQQTEPLANDGPPDEDPRTPQERAKEWVAAQAEPDLRKWVHTHDIVNIGMAVKAAKVPGVGPANSFNHVQKVSYLLKLAELETAVPA